MANRKLFVNFNRSNQPTQPGDESTGTLEQSNGNVSATESDDIIIGTETDSFNPASVGSGDSGTDTDNGTRRKRGRPRGSKNSGTNTKEKTQGVEKLLFSLHAMGATFLSMPELVIDQQEAKILAEGFQAVSDLYDVPVVPPWVTAYVTLGTALATVYGPRFAAYKMRTATEKKGQNIQPLKVVAPVQPSTLVVDPTSKVGVTH